MTMMMMLMMMIDHLYAPPYDMPRELEAVEDTQKEKKICIHKIVRLDCGCAVDDGTRKRLHWTKTNTHTAPTFCVPPQYCARTNGAERMDYRGWNWLGAAAYTAWWRSTIKHVQPCLHNWSTWSSFPLGMSLPTIIMVCIISFSSIKHHNDIYMLMQSIRCYSSASSHSADSLQL